MRIALALLLVCAAMPARALDILRCSLGQTQHGWIATSLVLAHEPGAGKAIVADDLGLHFTGKPSTARVTADTDRVLRFTWALPKLTDERGNLVPAMVYKATLTHGDSALRISAEPLGYSARFSGKGNCLPVPEAERRAMAEIVRKGG